MWFMHVQADLMNGIGDVRAGERQILESTHQAPISGWISDGGTSSTKLGLCVNQSGACIALSHSCTVEDIEDVLPLREEHASRRARNSNTKKIV
jgi:hypothetical protein